MKVYVVELCYYDREEYFICEIFSSREKAEKYMEKEGRECPLLPTEYYEIEEIEVL